MVAYALAGTVDWDPLAEPIPGSEVMLADLWPSQDEIARVVAESVNRQQFTERYSDVFTGSDEWREITSPESQLYNWRPDSTYIQEPTLFQTLSAAATPLAPISGMRVLAYLGDSVTTDHISPAGSIKTDSPAGRYLIEKGVQPAPFNSYSSRRSNDRVMTRGTFANVRIRNRLAPETEGGWTTNLLSGEVKSIYDASLDYQAAGVPLLVLAGKHYWMGSSRD
ncbi:hypothetical protein BH18ACT5_BH18ACT5_06440 [soil metagenome]